MIAIDRLPADSWQRALVLAVANMPAVILVMPLTYQCYVALGAPFAALPMALLALLLGALSGPLDAAARVWRWILPAIGTATVLVAAGAALVTSPS